MAATKKSPIQRMREQFKDKESLVDRLLDIVERPEGEGAESKDDAKSRLLSISNKKLLRLFETASEIRSKFGSLAKAAEAVATASGKAKDKDYVARLARFTPARLLALHKAAEKKSKQQAA